jgi:hypothetical protein
MIPVHVAYLILLPMLGVARLCGACVGAVWAAVCRPLCRAWGVSSDVPCPQSDSARARGTGIPVSEAVPHG